MKNLKKVLALVVVFTMVLSTVAFASYPDVDATADYAGAVELLSALSILKGDDTGNFNPDNNITRAEFAAVVCRALGLEGSANGAKGATDFTDVAADHWAAGYINLASQQKIINGMGDGTFAPESDVTYTQAVKMLVVALGYEPMAEKKGGYPAGYLATANSIGLTDGVPSTASDVAALRSTVAMLTANAMELPVMEQTEYGTESIYEVMDETRWKTLLTNMNIYVATGIVYDYEDATDKSSVIFTVTQKSDDNEFDNYEADDKYRTFVEYDELFLVNGSDIMDFRSEKVKAYVEKKNSKYYVVAVVPAEEGETLELDIAQIEENGMDTTKGYIEYYESNTSSKASKLYVSTDEEEDVTVEDLTIYVNGVKKDGETDNFKKYYDAYKDYDATLKFIENGEDRYFDVVEFTVYSYFVVSEVDADKERIVFTDGTANFAEVLDDEAYSIKFKDADGKDITIADFAENDVVAVVAKNPAKAYKPGDNNETIVYYNLGDSTVVGTVTSYNPTEGYIVIDSTEYEVVPSAATIGSTKGYRLGDEGAYFLTKSGKVFNFDGKRGSTNKYGYILSAGVAPTSVDGDVLQVKILTADQGIVTVDTYSTFVYPSGVADNAETEEDESIITIKAATATEAQLNAFADYYAKDGDASSEERLVNYKLSSSDCLKSIEAFADAASISDKYNADLVKVDGKYLDEGIKIFAIAEDVEDSYVTTLSVLADDAEYVGFVADKDTDDNTYAVAVITSGLDEIDRSQGIAVVSKVNTTTYNGDPATEVYVHQDSAAEAVKLIFTEDSKNKGAVAYADINAGSTLLYTADDAGVVTSYVVLSTVASKVVVPSAAGIAYADGEHANTKYEYKYGYIEKIKNGIVTLTNGEGEFKVTAAANLYTYQYKGRAASIVVDDYTAGNVDGIERIYNNDETFDTAYAFPVFIKLADGAVTDIYAFDNEVEVDENPTMIEEEVDPAPAPAPEATADEVVVLEIEE